MAFRKSSESNIKCEIIEKYGKLADGRKELRLVSWNGREPVYDLRSWSENDDGTESAGKGITLTGEECECLLQILKNIAEG